MDSQTAIDYSDLGPECPSSPDECRDSDGSRTSIADWVEREVDECMQLLMLGVIEPITRAIDRVCKDNARSLVGVQQAITQGVDSLIESNHEQLEPIISYVAALQATKEAQPYVQPAKPITTGVMREG